MSKIDSIVQDIEKKTGSKLGDYKLSSIGGGCINTAYKLQSNHSNLFIKLNQSSLIDMFEAEALGLQELDHLNCVRVPEVICFGQAGNDSYLAMEYIELGSLQGQASQQLGQQLAQLHQHQQPYFGWSINNTIGSTPQYNNREHDWLTFWQQQRLEKQLTFAANNGAKGSIQKKGQHLVDNLAAFFSGYTPLPSLLHGDLWGGNAAADEQGHPVIFDPASYYGDRETDIAMTELFGGFNNDFYAAYQAEYPLEPGYKVRKTLYNLYHILNHFNLFGGSYQNQAEAMIDQLLAEV